MWKWCLRVLLSFACCTSLQNSSGQLLSEEVGVMPGADTETQLKTESLSSQVLLSTSIFEHLSSSGRSSNTASTKPYAALFKVLFNTSDDSTTHYPTIPELETVLHNKLIRPAHPSPRADIDKERGRRRLHHPVYYDNSQAAGDSGHYRTLVNHLLASSGASPAPPPRLVVETNCDQYGGTAFGVGMWGSLHLHTRQEDSADSVDSAGDGTTHPLEVPLPAPGVLCANNWHLPSISTDTDTSSSRKENFLRQLRDHDLDTAILPITLTTGATATLTWLEQFKWTVDVIHFNAFSCDTVWDCAALAYSSLTLLRPGGVLTVQNRNSLMVETLRALSDYRKAEDKGAGNGGDVAFVQSQLFSGLVKEGSALSPVELLAEAQRQHQDRSVFTADIILKSVSNEVDPSAAQCESDEGGGGSRSASSVAVEAAAASLPSLVWAVNMIEAHVDAHQLHQLVAVLNANHASAVQWTTELLLDIYERYLLRQFQCHVVYPLPQDRRDHLGAHMATAVRTVTLPELGIEENSVWASIMGALLLHQKTQHESFHRYYELSMHPSFFHWEEYPTAQAGGDIFTELLRHPDYQHVRHVHREGEHFLFGVVPAQTEYEHHGTIYRPGRTQHVYNILMLRHVLGLWPTDFEQIVDYGGGSGDTAVTFRQLGFSGQYFIYDLPPVLFLQQYFLRYSGWPAYVVDEDSAHLHHEHFISGSRSMASATLLVSSLSNALNRVTDRTDEVLKKTLFYATFSLTESPLAARAKIVKTLVGIGVIFLRMMRIYEEFDNLEYALQLEQLLVDHPEYTYEVCMSFGGRDTLAFIAYRVDTAHTFSTSRPCEGELMHSEFMKAD